MSEWIPICALADIPPLGSRRVQRERGLAVAVFRTADDQVFALLDRCPHRNVPLSDGKLHASVAWAMLLGGYAPEEKLGAYSLASHLAFLVMNALLGLAFLPRVGREIWDQAERYARSRGPGAAGVEEDPPRG